MLAFYLHNACFVPPAQIPNYWIFCIYKLHFWFSRHHLSSSVLDTKCGRYCCSSRFWTYESKKPVQYTHTHTHTLHSCAFLFPKINLGARLDYVCNSDHILHYIMDVGCHRLFCECHTVCQSFLAAAPSGYVGRCDIVDSWWRGLDVRAAAVTMGTRLERTEVTLFGSNTELIHRVFPFLRLPHGLHKLSHQGQVFCFFRHTVFLLLTYIYLCTLSSQYTSDMFQFTAGCLRALAPWPWGISKQSLVIIGPSLPFGAGVLSFCTCTFFTFCIVNVRFGIDCQLR